MKALQIYAGSKARKWIAAEGLLPHHVGTIPGAAGGPKGLILGPLDRFIFGDWLPRSSQSVHLVGASIGAWRMTTACLETPQRAFERLERDYIQQHYELAPGQKRVSADQVSETFGRNISAFFGGRVQEVLQHPRFRLHIVTSHGRHLLRREHRLLTPVGYTGAFLTNAVQRKAMGAWLERVIFSTSLHQENGVPQLPFSTTDYRTRQVALNEENFQLALQASCSIPFVLRAVHDIPGAPNGAYWDGGITDYHLHLNYAAEAGALEDKKLVLYPHFQKAVVPGWLDKSLRWRHASTPFLDTTILLAPNPEWVATLPNGKLPDRTDFTRYGNDLASRVKVWTSASRASVQLAEEFAAWLERPDIAQLLPL
jgi:hypothetical protein